MLACNACWVDISTANGGCDPTNINFKWWAPPCWVFGGGKPWLFVGVMGFCGRCWVARVFLLTVVGGWRWMFEILQLTELTNKKNDGGDHSKMLRALAGGKAQGGMCTWPRPH